MLRWPVQAPTVVENERFEGDASLVGRQNFELVFDYPFDVTLPSPGHHYPTRSTLAYLAAPWQL